MNSQEKDSRITELESKVARLESQLELKDKLLLRAEQQLEWFRKQMYGQRSEKHLPVDPDALQLSLFENSIDPQEQARLDAAVAKDEADLEKTVTISAHERKVRKSVDTSKLEVREEHLYPEEIAGKESDYAELDPEVTDSLEIIPAQVYIRRIIRHKFVLKSSIQNADPERRAFEIAPLPAAPVHKCMAGASVLTDIVMQKFLYHLPFYRVVQKFKESGVIISDSTLNDWFVATCGKLKPLYDLLRKRVLQSIYIQVDESTLPVIDNEKHRAVKGYIWCVRDVLTGLVFFIYYNGSRSKETARKLLSSYSGAIQTDGYSVYDDFEGLPGKTMLGCWAHARRKFVEALEENKRLASEALVYIGDLYRIEAEMKDAGLDAEQKKERRQKESYETIRKFEDWMLAKYDQTTSGSLIRKAIEYTYKILPRLARYVNDGRYNIDNNLVENAIRPLALGRKNYMFCGNDDAACRAAIAYSLISSCKAVGIDPRTWMEDVLKRLPEYELGNGNLSELLPGNWQQKTATVR